MFKDTPKGLLEAVLAIHKESREKFIQEQQTRMSGREGPADPPAHKDAKKMVKWPAHLSTSGSSSSVQPRGGAGVKKGRAYGGAMQKEAAEGSTPRNEKEKKLAAMTPPRDKITHGDVLHGRGVRKEEAEQIDELSKKTMRSYMAKSLGSKSAHDYSAGVGAALAHASNIGDKNQQAIARDRNLELSRRRTQGLMRAIVKTTKEEVDLSEAKRLIHQEPGKTFSAKVYRDPEYNEFQVHFFKDGKHMGEGPVSYHDDKADAIGSAKTALKQMHARHTRNEEVEQIDELKKDTLKAYVGKAVDNVADTQFRAGKHWEKGNYKAADYESNKTLKRMRGIRRATTSMAKEEKDTPGNGYAHQCAIHVKSEQYGQGRTLTSQHAEPDAYGNIAWYDVMFDEGIKRVRTEDIEVLVSESHMNHKKKRKSM